MRGAGSPDVINCSHAAKPLSPNVEIRNGTITNFPNRGIFGDISDEFGLASGHRIISVRVISIGAEGIFLRGLHHTIRNCTVTNTQLELEQGFGGITCGPLCSVIGNVISRNNIIGIRTLGGCTIHEKNEGVMPKAPIKIGRE